MKKQIYISLLISLILILGFVLINSYIDAYTPYPKYSIIVIKGVDFSKVSSQGKPSNWGGSFNNTISKSLIPEQRSLITSSTSAFPEYIHNNSPIGNILPKFSSSRTVNSNPPTTGGRASAYGITGNNLSKNFSGGGGGSMIQISGSRRTNGFGYSSSSGSLASGSLAFGSSGQIGNNGGITAPPNPYIDYNENDITHPGGNPTGNQVPVGSGTLPFLLFVSIYVVILLKRS